MFDGPPSLRSGSILGWVKRMCKTVDDLLAEARGLLPSRLPPEAAAQAQAEGAILIDIRDDDQIRADGSIPGALEIPRNVLEWRCDPASRWHHPSICDRLQQLIVICNEGYQSSLAAANLQRLGFASATDVDGGFVAWKATKLPVVDGSRGRHWDEVYSRSGPDQVAWHERTPDVSLMLIDELQLPRNAAIIDVGGGASAVASHLMRKRFTDVTVLDVSAAALAVAPAQADSTSFRHIRHDVLRWIPDRAYDLWHDRALFHFFVADAERRAYIDVLKATLDPGASAIIATFAEDGPTHCTGLPVARYSFSELASAFDRDFCVIDRRREDHQTPTGTVQPFNWLVLRRTA